MKKFLTILIVVGFLFGFVGSTMAKSENMPKYEVKVHITYNSVTPEEMGKIVEKVGKNHGDACKVKFEAKKVGGNVYIDVTSTDAIYQP